MKFFGNRAIIIEITIPKNIDKISYLLQWFFSSLYVTLIMFVWKITQNDYGTIIFKKKIYIKNKLKIYREFKKKVLDHHNKRIRSS